MPQVDIPESLADLIERTGRQLVEDYAILSEHMTLNRDVKEVLALHAKTGQSLINFVKRSREQGRVINDEEGT